MTAAISETPVAGPDVDADAPYGRKADGTPKRGWGGRPPAGKKQRATSRPRRTAGTTGPAKKSTPRKPASTGTADYTEPATALVQVAAGVATMLAKLLPEKHAEAVQLDAVTLHMAAEEIGAVGNTMAHNMPSLAGLLDRFNSVSPWGDGIMLGIGLAAQFAVNHRIATAEQTSGFGTKSREELMMMAGAMAPAPRNPEPEPRAEHAEPPAEPSVEPPAPAPEPVASQPEPDTNGHRFYDVPMPGMPPVVA